MIRVAIFAFGLIWSCIAAWAGFFSAGVTSTGNCPNGSAYADGCAAASAATFIQPNFFTTARQSSQTYATRPPWNVAGVDYAVGTTTAVASLTDIASVGTSIPGCTYNSNYLSYAPALVCASVASPTISGYDFGPNAAFKSSGGALGHDCVLLIIANTVTGTVNIRNNRFEFGWTGASVPSKCSGGATTQSGSYPLSASYANSTLGGAGTVPIIQFSNSMQASAIIENNEFDGNYAYACCQTPPVGKSGIQPISFITTNAITLTIRYNVFKEIAGATMIGSVVGGTAKFVMKYNYTEGWIKRAPAGHGEAMSISGSYDTFTGSFNTYFATKDMCFCNTGIWWLQSSNSTTINAGTIDHNTVVTNNPDGATTTVLGTVSGTISDGAGGPGNMLTVTGFTGVGPTNGAALVSTYGGQIYAHVNGSPTSGVGSQWLVDCGNGAAVTTTNPCPNATGANVTTIGPNASTPGVMYGTGYGQAITITNITLKGGYANGAAAQVGHGTWGALTFDSNYIDPTGGYAGAVWVATAPLACSTPATFTGNINLLTGDSTSVNAWSSNSSTGC